MAIIAERERLNEIMNGKVFYLTGTVKFKTYEGKTGFMTGSIPSTLVFEEEITGQEAEKLKAIARKVGTNEQWQVIGGYNAKYCPCQDQNHKGLSSVVLYPLK